MALALSIAGIAYAAICVCLAVRIINRRERWAKWTFAVVLALPILYPLSFGPWEAARFRTDPTRTVKTIDRFFDPAHQFAIDRGPEWLARPYRAYLNWWTDGRWGLAPYRGAASLGPGSDLD